MPLYKLFCISAHYPEFQHIKDLVTRSATLMLAHGSPVRSIEHLGTRILPQKMRRHKTTHTVGDYWTMHFDAPPHLAQQLSSQLRDDPRVIRWTALKLGERLEDVAGRQPYATRQSFDDMDDEEALEKMWDDGPGYDALGLGPRRGYAREDVASLGGLGKR